MTPIKTWLGYPYPLGATWLGNGVNFALFSEHATSVDLCLFDSMEARRGKRPHSGNGTYRPGLAHFPARSATGTNLRLSGFRSLRTGNRNALQQFQAAS